MSNEFCMEYRSIYIINNSPPCVEYVVLLIKRYAINYVRKLLRYTKFQKTAIGVKQAIFLVVTYCV